MMRTLTWAVAAIAVSIPALADDLPLIPAPLEPGIHPMESYTVVYALDGNVKGTVTEMSRLHGGQVVRVTDSTAKFLWRKETQQNRMIGTGARILTIDEIEGTAVATFNPQYDERMAAFAAADGSGRADAYMAALGLAPTERTMVVAGEPCDVYEGDEANLEICFTDDGLVLNVAASKFGFDYIQTATEVRRGDAGPDVMFDVPAGLEIVDGGEQKSGFGG